MRIAVAGGTGVVGAYAVKAAEDQDHDVVVLARSRGVDVRTGQGLDAALVGVEAIIDTTNGNVLKPSSATSFFVEVAGHLQRAGSRCGAGHVVTLSIVGLERVPGYGYYRAKLAHEEAALTGVVPASILRATQFHEFPAQILHRARRGPIALMPRMRVQPVAARTVGTALVDLAVGAPVKRASDLAGPEPADLVALARAVLARRGVRASVLPMRMPGAAATSMRSGALLPTSGARLEGPTFEDWLAGPDVEAIPI